MAYLRGQDEIRAIMLRNTISYAWIAEKLDTYYQKIQYYVETSKKDDDILYNSIMLLFEKHGYATSSQIKCDNLIDEAFRSNARFNEELKRINNAILKDIQDGRYTPNERLRMRTRLEDSKTEVIELFDRMIRLTYADNDQC